MQSEPCFGQSGLIHLHLIDTWVFYPLVELHINPRPRNALYLFLLNNLSVIIQLITQFSCYYSRTKTTDTAWPG